MKACNGNNAPGIHHSRKPGNHRRTVVRVVQFGPRRLDHNCRLAFRNYGWEIVAFSHANSFQHLCCRRIRVGAGGVATLGSSVFIVRHPACIPRKFFKGRSHPRRGAPRNAAYPAGMPLCQRPASACGDIHGHPRTSAATARSGCGGRDDHFPPGNSPYDACSGNLLVASCWEHSLAQRRENGERCRVMAERCLPTAEMPLVDKARGRP